MHSTVLVICLTSEDDASFEDVKNVACEYMESYRGHYDFYGTKLSSLCSAMVDSEGSLVQFCRASDFCKFNVSPPRYILSTFYIERDLMEKYGVSWDTVVSKEIACAKDEDSDENPVYFCLLDVHI